MSMRVSTGVSDGLVGLVLVLRILYMRMLTCRAYIVRSVVGVLCDVLRHRGFLVATSVEWLSAMSTFSFL